ncbi:MAG TPA: SDR family oxidoreductase [Bacteroidia bacterium]|jgi:NAD(P)-dependent dehydrogenase (short-subunit alcohol dehydrogenase family)
MAERKIALVTGGNKGIGFEVCRQLAEKGFAVILTARDEKKGKKATSELASGKMEVIFQQLDVSDANSIEQAKEFVASTFGRLDVLVNCAGIIVNSADSTKVKLEEVKETFETNFFGMFAVSQACIPLLKKSHDARIINFSSGMGSLNEPGGTHFAYRTSKTAVNGLTAVMSVDLAPHNIKVNCLCPGWVRTDMGGKGAPRSVAEGADTAVWLATADNIPTGKIFQDRKQIEW